MLITSKSNSLYKRIKKLIASSKARREEGLFVVEGRRIVSEAPDSLLEEVVVSETYAKENKIEEGVIFSDELFRALSDTVNPQGILALVRQPSLSFDEIILKDKGGEAFYLLLDDINDPGNLGTIIRTAEAAGINGVFLSEGCADIFNPKVIRSTMGSIYRVPFAKGKLINAAVSLKGTGVKVYAASLEAEKLYNEAALCKRKAVVIGNEARGVCEEILAVSDEKIKIPMAGEVESLNAAVSAAVIMYGIKG